MPKIIEIKLYNLKNVAFWFLAFTQSNHEINRASRIGTALAA